jgi:predicted MFS family arabinose efflux permease
MALLADLTRPTARTRAMTVIGVSIGASFVLSLVAGPWLAGLVGVQGMFAVIGVLGAVAMSLMLFGVPDPPARALPRPTRAWAGVLSFQLLPHYAGVFMLHLTLTAVFVAVPFALRDFHGIEAARHWQVYLTVFAASLLLTLPLVLWSERNRGRAPLLTAGFLLVLALAALGFWQQDLRIFGAALAFYFGAFNFIEARLPALLTGAAGEAARGAALGVFSTCQFAGAFAGGVVGGMLLGSVLGLPGVLFGAAFAALAWLPLALRAETR